MSKPGEMLQNFNSELEKSLISIKERSSNVLAEINREEQQKHVLEEQITSIKNELFLINQVLENKYELKNEYEKVLFNSETAFKKILENSKTLLSIIKKDENIIKKKICDNDFKENNDVNVNSKFNNMKIQDS